MSRVRLSLAVVLIVAVGACGGSEKSKDGVVGTPVDGAAATTQVEGDVPAGVPAGDECALATNEEVAAAVGVEVANSTGSDNDCSYSGTDGALLLAFVYVGEGGKSTFESQRQAGELIEGIGDGAIYFEGGGMYVLKGDGLINMTALENVTLVGDAALRTALETVARLAVDRL